jgi:hypothetical protein
MVVPELSKDSSDPEVRNVNKFQKVEMIFIPNKKLETGVYMVEI